MNGRKLFPLVVVAAGLLAYSNSFRDAFFIDDGAWIEGNPRVHHLSLVNAVGGTSRPVVQLSLALNYAMGGLDVRGYHAFNLIVHLLAALTLYGIVRRTLTGERLRSRYGQPAEGLALAVALLWLLHPLQTESVTYIIQRCESMMGLFYLLTLYCVIRGAELGNGRLWYAAAVIACALGMASKEVMVSAPLMVMLYDRAFLTNSFREGWRRRGPLYLALAGTWILLGFLLVSAGSFAKNAAMNAQVGGVTWWQYLATQPGVILHYLRLSVWPYPLLLGHGWPAAKRWTSILPPAVVVAILVAATGWAWRTNPAATSRLGPVWGFVGAWFFLILAPTSSFIPLYDLIYEHRMYLSLAAVVSVVVMGLYSLVGRRSLVVFVAMAVGLGVLTWRRNQDYRSEIAMRFSAVAKLPNDPLARYSLGVALEKTGRTQEAIAQYEQALRINPNIAEVHNNLGLALAETGRTQEAVGHYEQALRINPDSAETYNNLAIALVGLGKLPAAVDLFEQALQIKPDFAEAHYNLGKALRQSGKIEEAIGQYEAALGIRPEYAEAHYNLGNAFLQVGRIDDAIGQYEQALRLKPNYAEAHYNLGVALEQSGRVEDAIRHWEQALRIKPDFSEAQSNLARLRTAH
ncbi:MAG TPA: tetratricopeptide repeat protein [Verrucomicrobiae bacterium]|nr:tetratricopeptide repeat protein [Verrucomicrobiae bacterium]